MPERPGNDSMIGRGLIGGITSSVKFTTLTTAGREYLEWVVASQGTTTFDVGQQSAVEGGVRVLDFGIPAYQFSAFARVALTGDGEEGQPLVIDIAGLLAAYGLNSIQAGGSMAVGHARLMSAGADVPGLFHVARSALGATKLAIIDSSGAVFTAAMVGDGPTCAVEMMVEFQALND
jgi:hypothetical protein